MKLISKNSFGIFINEGGKYCTLSLYWSKIYGSLYGIRLWIQGLELSLLYSPVRKPLTNGDAKRDKID